MDIPYWIRPGTRLRAKKDFNDLLEIRNIHPVYAEGRQGHHIDRPVKETDSVWFTIGTYSSIAYILEVYEPILTERCRYCYGK